MFVLVASATPAVSAATMGHLKPYEAPDDTPEVRHALERARSFDNQFSHFSDRDKAVEFYRRVIELRPDGPESMEVRFRIAALCQSSYDARRGERARPDDAIATYRRVLERTTARQLHYVRAAIPLSICLKRKREFAEAGELLENVLAVRPADLEPPPWTGGEWVQDDKSQALATLARLQGYARRNLPTIRKLIVSAGGLPKVTPVPDPLANATIGRPTAPAAPPAPKTPAAPPKAVTEPSAVSAQHATAPVAERPTTEPSQSSWILYAAGALALVVGITALLKCTGPLRRSRG